LKLRRNLYGSICHLAKNRDLALLVTFIAAVAAGSLILGGLAEWRDLSMQAGWGQSELAFAGGWVRLTVFCYFVGAVGVILLGWQWLRLTGAITSIARQLEQKQFKCIKPGGHRIAKKLCEAVNGFFSSQTGYIAELKEQVKDLQVQIQVSRGQKKNIEAIIYSIRDAVIVIDEFDNLLMANEAAGRILNFNFHDSQHKRIDELIASEPADVGEKEFINFLRQSRQGKTGAARREIDFSRDGRTKTFDCIVSCVHDKEERSCGAVAVLHDITREKEISQMKNDFVSHVSHELKTPLASITAYSEMLCDGEADDEETRSQFYSVIQGQAKRLNRLIEDILNISRIESGLIKVEKRPVSLTILIAEQLQMIRSYAEEKNIEIVAQKAIVFDQVNVDKDMLSQVIVNLLSNAVKYTPSGGTISVETQVDEAAGTVQVSITDTGVGIPEDELEHVFEKFYRVKANKGQAKGTGLGLNLVKQIVEKVHDGRVFVRSEPGKGSTFGFGLPLARAKVAQA
jgi:two-component system phosphate regulon sensor histidine kinase PhoR